MCNGILKGCLSYLSFIKLMVTTREMIIVGILVATC